MTIGQLLEQARLKLAEVSQTDQPPGPDRTGEARTEAEILMCHALEVSRSFFYANPETVVPQKRKNHFMRLVKNRCNGTPVAYLTGTRAFWTLNLQVNPAVLIPRHETETLVEQALELIPHAAPFRIADLGTGSGAIALSIAKERPSCEVHATDFSAEALQVAKENARLHDLHSVQYHQGSWTEPLSGFFDLVVSNPPYVAQQDPHLQQGDCRFEPTLALVSGEDGLSALKQIAKESLAVLKPGGWLLFEHGYDQGDAVRSILKKAGYNDIRTVPDLAGIERCAVGQKPG
jgi:release factor glutamine methyltransferase